MAGSQAILALYTGFGDPKPVPRDIVEAIRSVEVQASAGAGESGFSLTLDMANELRLRSIFLVAEGRRIPTLRIAIAATLAGKTQVLIDGIVTHHEFTSGSVEGGRQLVVRGRDMTDAMRLPNFTSEMFPGMSERVRARVILAKYQLLGVIPVVVPPVLEEEPSPVEKIPTKHESDYEYLTRLARAVGYVFFVEPAPAIGASFAYWGPNVKVGPVQPPLNCDMDALTNVESLSCSFDMEQGGLPVVWTRVGESLLSTTVPVPIPPVTPFNPPLGLVPPPRFGVMNLRGDPVHGWREALLRGLAHTSQREDAVTVTGSLDVARYGSILRPRRLVTVRGAGKAFDGLYYVTEVTHTIRRGEYKQSFTLKRNGLLSTLPRVPDLGRMQTAGAGA